MRPSTIWSRDTVKKQAWEIWWESVIRFSRKWLINMSKRKRSFTKLANKRSENTWVYPDSMMEDFIQAFLQKEWWLDSPITPTVDRLCTFSLPPTTAHKVNKKASRNRIPARVLLQVRWSLLETFRTWWRRVVSWPTAMPNTWPHSFSITTFWSWTMCTWTFHRSRSERMVHQLELPSPVPWSHWHWTNQLIGRSPWLGRSPYQEKFRLSVG